MQPRFFCDINVGPGRARSRQGFLVQHAMTLVFVVLHGVLRKQPGRYAIALPRMKTGASPYPGDQVRVFAGARSDLDEIVDALRGNEAVQEVARIEYARPVPDDFAGPWVEYRRFRVPGPTSRFPQAREQRLKTGDELPFFRVVSKSNGHGFSIRVQQIEHNQAPQSGAELTPDSYGLSGVRERSFALPAVSI